MMLYKSQLLLQCIGSIQEVDKNCYLHEITHLVNMQMACNILQTPVSAPLTHGKLIT